MSQATTAGAGPSEQFIDVLALALAGELHQAKFADLSNLRARRIGADGRREMLQQLQLVAARLHINEVDDDHATDVAQLQLAGDFRGCFVIRPQHRFTRIGRTREGTGVHVDHREGLGGLDDHVAAGGQIHPGLQRIVDGSVDLEMLKDRR